MPDLGHRGPQAGGRRPAAQVHPRRQVRAADRQEQPEQGRRRHRQRASRGGRLGAAAHQRGVRRRRLRQPPRHRVRRRHRRVQADLGRVRQAARRQGQLRDRAADGVCPGRWPAGLQRRAFHPRVERRHGLSRRPREPARADVHQRRQVREAAPPDRGAVCRQPRVLARSGAAVPVRRRRQGDHHRRPQDARRPGPGPGGEAARRRPPHRDRFQGQSLHRGDRHRHAAAAVQRDVGAASR